MRALLAAALLVGCAKPQYLGADVPRPCRAQDVEGCLGWMVERDLVAAELGVYDDRALRAYVQGVVDRLARTSLLTAPPRVLIADSDGTYATIGGRIVVGRATLERLASEAELAGVVAHELAHLEGRHTTAALYERHAEEEWRDIKLDAESVADERAVELLARAGYAPVAMSRALRAVLEVEDEDHPAIADRIARVEALAAGRRGYEGRDELLAASAGMIAGRDSRLGVRVADAWVIASLGIALPLDATDVVRSTDDVLALRRDHTKITGYVIGAPWARELGKTLEESARGDNALGRVTQGIVPTAPARDDTPLGKLQRAIRATLPQPRPGAHVAILERQDRVGALVVERNTAEDIALHVRVATVGELAAAEPARIVLVAAPRAGAIAALDVCRDRLLDDGDRHVVAGARIKCADRALASPTI